MKRRGTTSQVSASLFPFMSVLVSFMGVLMFLCAAMAFASLGHARRNIQLDLTGNWREKQPPIVIRCLADGAQTADGTSKFEHEQELSAAEMSVFKGTPFTDFLNELAKGDGAEPCILFIVKPEGVKVFDVLRRILVVRNREYALRSVQLKRKVESRMMSTLDSRLLSRIQWQDNALSFRGIMTEEERNLLKKALGEAENGAVIDHLHESTQSSRQWLNYGSELIPDHWEVSLTEVKEF